jgi:hypothetical protein
MANSPSTTSAPATVRLPWNQPFAADSPWNIGIGSGAQWESPNSPVIQELHSLNGMINVADWSLPVFTGTASDPLVTIVTTDGEMAPVQIHVPLDAVPSGGTDRNMSFFDETQPGHVWTFWNVQFDNGHDVSGGMTAGLGSVFDTAGDGFSNPSYNPGQVGANYVGGIITPYDLSQGTISHMLRIALSDGVEAMPAGATWDTQLPFPITNVDYNGPTAYTGIIPAGSTFGIPASVDLSTLGLSQGGLMVARALQQYGAVWGDTAGTNQFTIYSEPQTAGNPLMQQAQADMQKLMPYMSILSNQSAETVNGGGTYPAPPLPFDPSLGIGSGEAPGYGGSTPPTNAGGTTPPTNTGGTVPPTSAGGTVPPTSTGGTVPPTSTGGSTAGSGSDTLILKISEDAFANADGASDAEGDATFSVMVNGKQVGGTFAATASHSAGQDQSFTLNGSFGADPTASVTFLNDAWNPGAPDANGSSDRNLYVDAITYDGIAQTASAPLYSGGAQSFGLTGGPAAPGGSAGAATPPATGGSVPPPATGGGPGPDTLILKVSEDAFVDADGASDAKGDAAFTVTVNGKQVGGTLTATASHDQGQEQTIALSGIFGADPTVAVTFVNDAWDPAAPDANGSYDRNLYVDAITYDGTAQTASAPLYSGGAQGFALHSGAASAVVPHGSATLIDDTGAKASISVIGSGSKNLDAGSGISLDGNVHELVDKLGVLNMWTDTFAGGVVSTSLKDTGGASYHLSNFLSTNVELGGANAGTLSIDGAAGGTIKLDSGNYVVNVAAQADAAGTAAQNRFTATLGGSGNHVLTIDESGTYGISSNVLNAGAGTDRMTLIGAGSSVVHGGAGKATVIADSGANTFTAGSGTLDVTGGPGANKFVFHAGNGVLKIEDFSLAHGDTLTVDKALQSALKEASDGHGGVMLTFGTSGHGVDLVGLPSLAASSIHFV